MDYLLVTKLIILAIVLVIVGWDAYLLWQYHWYGEIEAQYATFSVVNSSVDNLNELCDNDEDCIDGESEFLLDDITINSHEASVSDPVSITYDMSYLNTLCIKTTFNPATPTPIIPNGCNCAPMENLPQYPNILTEDSGSIKDLTIYINKSYVGTLSIEKKDSCP